MKIITTLLLLVSLATAGCVSTVTAPTTAEEQRSAKLALAAAAAEDVLAILLPPVLAKNPGYLEAAKGVADIAGAFVGENITGESVKSVLVKAGLSGEDAGVVAGIVVASWDSYTSHYRDALGVSVKPDVQLFLKAVSRGVARAITYVPTAQRASLAAPK